MNGRSYTIIGVAPRDFYGTEIISAPQMWFPMAMQAQIEVGSNWLDRRDAESIFVQGRLKPGVSMAQAQASINSIALELAREFPDVNEGKRVTLSPPGMIGGTMRGPVMGFIGVLMVVVGLVLLLACTNLANLLLARATERRREIAVRLAVGASRLRLIRQLLTESVLLALGGGLLGLLLASWLVKLASAIKMPMNMPVVIDLQIDYRVLVFTGVLSFVTGVLFGLLPALQATKTDLVSALKDEVSFGGHRRSWLKSGLIVFQVALSLVLLIGGGLMLRALQQAQTLKLGFNPQNAVEMSFDLRLQGYDSAQGKEFQKRLLERVRALPGVQSAGIADLVPVDLHFSRTSVFIEGQPLERTANTPVALYSRVSPGYFQAMDTRLIQGRDFTEQDDEKAVRVAIVNETFARRFWPGEDPIGKRFSLGRTRSNESASHRGGRRRQVRGIERRPETICLSPDMAILLRVNNCNRSHRSRCAATACRRSPRSAATRFAPACFQQHAGRANEPAVASGAHNGFGTGRLRIAGACACCDWNLRRDVLFDLKTHARNRHSHGVGRAKNRCIETGDEAGNYAHAHRAGNRFGNGAGVDAIDKEFAVRRERGRSGDVCHRLTDTGCGGITGLLSASAASRKCRPDGRTALRVS